MSVLAGRKLAVLLGGTAAEREVSLNSGAAVAAALREAGATVVELDPAIPGWSESLLDVEFVFNLLHGPGGEDGCIQGFCETLGIPYSGTGVAGAALTMDKVNTKRIWSQAGLPTAPFVVLDEQSDWEALIAEYGCLFVKPAREGSSLGMSRVDNAAALQVAWQEAARYGQRVLAERFVAGDEFTVTILGGRALPSIRIEAASDFYDYDAKYIAETTRFHCPSGLDADTEAELGALAERAFSVVGAEVWGRVDVIREADGGWQLLEVNTVPGMTSHSLVPMSARAAGMSMPELLAVIYEQSLEVRPNGS
ncbi:MAG: D-alanine--D-alanine ligase [Halieaceae bacterium]|nr:D-alanine--D-alanine ligase [Halieaceae bacterium]